MATVAAGGITGVVAAMAGYASSPAVQEAGCAALTQGVWNAGTWCARTVSARLHATAPAGVRVVLDV